MFAGKRALFIQFVAFNLIGLVNTLIDYAVFQGLVWLGVFYIVAQIISYGAGTANSFIMNRAFTFKKQQGTGKHTRTQAARFIVLNLFVLLVSLLLLYLFADLGGLPYWLSKLLVTGVTVIMNFIGSKRWVFRSEAMEAPENGG
ncbi:GtrA family protein [Paenibacillus protaetiae]|uniref:GtrA family protein n=1 Tax=Paenibacillus protaetiae TaxID=2509456 RepID=A0A4P6EXC6_9BACL|nr:GtrA family protein [Paenibacillus protaetiae]QAY67406.1 GtrA family protein [Paenibacillus protaetiae]